jgi:hypothetical protein
VDELRDVASHAELEAFSVLTLLPPAQRVSGEDAARGLRAMLPGQRLRLPQRRADGLVPRLAATGIHGGAAYDALIALTAAAHEQSLLTADLRASQIYERLGVAYESLVRRD